MILPLLCSVLCFVTINSYQLDNFQLIADIVNSKKTTWTAENTFPSHITPSGFKTLLGVKTAIGRLQVMKKSPLADSEVPLEFDSRKQWPRCVTIGHIQDQGNCAAGWAIATAGAFSDRLCIGRNGSYRALLSSEQLLACCDGFGQGCQSGSVEDAWEFIQTHGIVSGGDYKSERGCQPYEIEPCNHRGKNLTFPDCSTQPQRKTPRCIRRCTNRNYEGRYNKDHHKSVSSFSIFDDAIEIQKEIVSRGPVEAIMYIFSDFFTYKSGIYHYITGEYLGDQAVRIIGWGTENGTDFWIVANSWNTEWGEAGFFRIKRGINACGIESYISGGIPEV
uniref:Cathepsin B n=1 Tax=Riptortus pedestris TaxID=329032 RepID=R4WDE0_RIPPE|nr:cathepsin B [Riptortus pedestris]